jgi:pimeloyl-ACP methyl ester carboxylesterase
MSRDLERFKTVEGRLWDSVGVTPTERYVGLRTGETVRLQLCGEGPPILFVHGASNGGSSWASLVAVLGGFRCILLDRPGCGLSEPIAGGARLGDIAEVEEFADGLVCDVLDALELSTAHIAATSYGGYFALRGAAAHPDRVERVVIYSWMMGAPMAKVPISMRIAGVPGVGWLMGKIPPTRGSIKMILRQIGLGAALESGRFTDEMFDWFASCLRDTETMANEMRSMPRLITPLHGLNERMLMGDDLLERVLMPVSFLWGTDDPNGGEEIAETFVQRLPDAELEMVPNAGHAPWIDEPELCAERTRSCLQ